MQTYFNVAVTVLLLVISYKFKLMQEQPPTHYTIVKDGKQYEVTFKCDPATKVGGTKNMVTMVCSMHWDDSVWLKPVERKSKL